MTILLKGVDMPRSCDECPCFSISCYEDEIVCNAACKVLDGEGAEGNRQGWCPLVEVEEAWYSHHPQKSIYAKLP